MMTSEEIKVIRAMETYGGGFVEALATAYIRADGKNRSKIRETWPELWEQYWEMAEKVRQRDEEGP